MIISYDSEIYDDFEPDFYMKGVPREVGLRFFIAYLVRRKPGIYTEEDIIHQLDVRFGNKEVDWHVRSLEFGEVFEQALRDGYIGCRVDSVSGGYKYYPVEQVDGRGVRKKRRK